MRLKFSGFGRNIVRSWVAIAFASGLGACAYMPDEGPSARGVIHGATAKKGSANYTLIDLDSPTAAKVAAFYDARLQSPVWQDLPPARSIGAVASGDVLDITIWDANVGQGGEELTPGSLSASQGKGFAVVAAVDSTGMISVPYAGRWLVAGFTPAQIEQQLVRRLGQKFVDVQASVIVKENIANTVFFEGDVLHPGRVALQSQGLRLLQGLALAGGSKDPDPALVVTVERGHITASWPLIASIQDRQANIPLSPGDAVTVSLRPTHYYAFGAVNRPGVQELGSTNQHLAEVAGTMQGLQDARANPAGFFIFRYEPASLVAALQPSSEKVSSAQPVVYRLDMRDPQSFFVLSTFPVQPGDILYVSNARIAELAKFLQLVSGFGTSIQTGKNVGNQ